MPDAPFTVVELTAPVRAQLVEEKATCPFLASVIATGDLPVRNEVANPLAGIDDVRSLGNRGGGNLGDLLAMFATGNHAYMRGPAGRLDEEVPAGLFSLELPGSQGSHPGHSGILQGDPQTLGSGRLSETDFARLARRAEDGLIKRSDVGAFIAENLARDPRSKVLGWSAAGLLARDLGELASASAPALLTRLTGSAEESREARRRLTRKLTRLLGEDNLFGSAGEFGLLFAFFANRPGAQQVEGEPTLPVDDLRAMFIDRRLPNGWEKWEKRRLDWVTNTTGLVVSAGREYLRLTTRP